MTDDRVQSNQEIVAKAQQERLNRERSYREQALKMYPWVCGRCGREFSRVNLQELTVHHRDHDHDNNPADGSNWELLCLYCHDNEHQRLLEADALAASGSEKRSGQVSTHSPFAGLKQMLEENKTR